MPLLVTCSRVKGVVGGNARDDLAAFWLRKTKKPVLAVLLVQKRGGQPQLYRGTNMEVRTGHGPTRFRGDPALYGVPGAQKAKLKAYIYLRACPLSPAIPLPSTVNTRAPVVLGVEEGGRRYVRLKSEKFFPGCARPKWLAGK